MANQIIYKKDSDADLWAEAKRVAQDSRQSLSELVADSLRAYLGGPHRPEPVRRTAPSYTPAPPPVAAPNPFAAKD